MNPAAPQAPVAAGGKPAGKNSKAHHAGTPVALARGAAKGSAAFQQLLSARTARAASAAAARGGLHAKETLDKAARAAGPESDSPESAGLKKALEDLLKHPATAHRPGDLPEDSAQLAASLKKHDDGKGRAAAKAAPAAVSTAAAQLVALAHADGQAVHRAPAKEAKTEPPETAKAPTVAAAGSAHRQEPTTRVIDLRRPQKSADAAPDRKAEPAAAQPADRDPSGGLVRDAGPRAPFADTSPRPPAAPATVTQAPLDRLREMAGSELVRASTMVLRDGGGEIRLVLKPESLGSVRVRMNLVDNHIEGRIIVDSAAVKHVFDGSVDALRRALTAEGFQMGSLQVSVGGQDAQRDQGRQERQPAETVRRVEAAKGFDRSVPGAEDVSLGDLFVNLFV